MMRWVFGADTTPFRKGLDEMRTQTKAFSGSIKGMLIGAIGVGAIINGFKNLFVEMDRVQKLALRFGASAEEVQKISHAASLAGTDMEGLAKAITVATRNSVEAAQNGGELAKAFGRLGIDASKFANLSMEGKVLALAENFDGSSASAEQLTDIIKVLGKSGAEMLPLLIQGQEELRKQFDETSTVSQSTVDTIATFNDAIESLKQKAQVAGGEVVAFFAYMFGGIKAIIERSVADTQAVFTAVVDSATTTGDIIEKVFSGDLGGAAKSAKKFQSIWSKELKNISKNAEDFGVKWNEINNPKGKPQKKIVDVEAIAEMEKAEERKKKLTEEIAKLKEEAAMDELSIAEKLLALEEKRIALGGDIEFSGGDTLDQQKEYLETEKEIKKLKEEQAKITEDAAKKADDLAKKAQEKEAKKNEDLQKAKDEEAKVDRDKAFGAADDQGKLDMLKKEQEVLMQKSKEAAAGGDEEAAIRLRTEAKMKEADRTDLLDSLLEKTNAGPTIATSSLAAIGAGGSANLLGNTNLEQRKVSLLEQIAQNTGRTETGSQKLPEPV